MNIQIERKAYLSNFEIACEGAIIALLADLWWLLHDVLTNGLSIWYLGVGLGLSVGVVMTGLALYRHHKSYTHRLLRKLRGSK